MVNCLLLIDVLVSLSELTFIGDAHHHLVACPLHHGVVAIYHQSNAAGIPSCTKSCSHPPAMAVLDQSSHSSSFNITTLSYLIVENWYSVWHHPSHIALAVICCIQSPDKEGKPDIWSSSPNDPICRVKLSVLIVRLTRMIYDVMYMVNHLMIGWKGGRYWPKRRIRSIYAYDDLMEEEWQIVVAFADIVCVPIVVFLHPKMWPSHFSTLFSCIDQ